MNTETIKKGALLESDALEAEYRKRRVDYVTETISKNTPIPESWEILRELKTQTRIKKKKDHDVLLEDKIWRLLMDMGTQKLSSRDFTFILKRRDGIDKTKQIDVLAIDDNIVFVVECKSQEKLGKKSLKKEIAEFAGIKEDIRVATKSLLETRDLEFVFLFATENIIWDQNDKLDAKEAGILIWDEYDVLALQELARLAGQAAKYQIYNRVFFGKKIKGFKVRVPALEAKMGGHTYYAFVLSPDDLLKIAYVHHRSGQFTFLELSDSYQRMIKESRLSKIEQFIEEGGFFPGSIIINFHRPFLKKERLGTKEHLDQLRTNVKPFAITLPPYYGCAWIVDGQHRLYGFADTERKMKETVPVVAFVEESGSTEAKMFVDINQNQKSIEANLLWDLYEDLHVASNDPQEQQLYAISRIAKKLNSLKESPFCGHIAIPKEQNSGNLTLTTICGIIGQQRLISPSEGILFSNSINDSIDYATERIICFFDVIRKSMTDEWEAGDKHYVRTNAGFVVLAGILADIVGCNLTKTEKDKIVQFREKVENFLTPLIKYLKNASPDIIAEYRGAGGAGQKSRQVRAELTKVIASSRNLGFRSPWLEKYEESKKQREVTSNRKGISEYLDRDENDTLEFKGSMSIDVDRYLRGDGKLIEDPKILEEGILKSIVAFLNTRGGDIFVGILEKSRYEDVYDDKLSEFPVYKDKIVFGIESEYKKDGWDGYERRLTDFIEHKIGSSIIDAELVKITKMTHERKDVCHISVEASDSKQYLDNSKFFIRRLNKTMPLHGNQIDDFWKVRFPRSS